MSRYVIPLEPESQSFSIALGGVEYRLAVRWFEPGGWLLDISSAEDVPILVGVPLVAGCDLLGQYGYLGLGGSLFLSGDIPPTLNNLGIDVELIFEVDDGED